MYSISLQMRQILGKNVLDFWLFSDYVYFDQNKSRRALRCRQGGLPTRARPTARPITRAAHAADSRIC